ncbi:MAG: 4Fe-4S dicluster domain-containing protein, partial [Chloroflexi bacterium]|nr:4Fe-4S dicluster domain-containing protein [Chloroflexota bacterium]
RRILHDGFVTGSAYPTVSPTVIQEEVGKLILSSSRGDSTKGSTGLELVFAADASVYDGRFANNGWLQELPDPLTKLTWDNAVILGPKAAERFSVASGDMVDVSLVGGSKVTAAVLVSPGQHPQSATLTLGYGRSQVGRIAEGAGFNFYKLRRSDAMGFVSSATITKVSGKYKLATTQHHHAVDTSGGKGLQKRLPTIFRESTLEHYKKEPDFVKHAVHVPHRLSLWEEGNLTGANYRWAMSIDLSSCTGCSACVVACQAENNIPIVGKDQVMRGREMHWIRVDRYFKGTDAQTPESVALQPVPCMQCENAACEQVCPVAATTHDRDGINVMVYNRCIGTRYCSNNCAYKVRRFNFFDYQVREPVRDGGIMAVKPSYYTRPQSDTNILQQLQFNPEVTVRSRGVMEKCTYCTQRIAEAKINAKNNWVNSKHSQDLVHVPIADGTIKTACEQACPANAIVFGDLNDPTSRVTQRHAHHRTYEMLEEINPKARTRYMAKLRNPSHSSNGHAADDHSGGSHSG